MAGTLAEKYPKSHARRAFRSKGASNTTHELWFSDAACMPGISQPSCHGERAVKRDVVDQLKTPTNQRQSNGLWMPGSCGDTRCADPRYSIGRIYTRLMAAFRPIILDICQNVISLP